MDVEGFTFYFGAASGSSRKALRKLDEPDVMINYATQNNKPWYGIENLFIDSGGYSFIKGKGEYETTDSEYATWVLDKNPEYATLRDYPCEPEVLQEHDRTVSEHQEMTLDRHISTWEELDGYEGQRVSVLQGWKPHEYLDHLDMLQDHGVLSEYVGIGSVCRRHAETEIRDVVLSIREAVPDSVELHAFGVKSSVLKFPEVRDALASADSQSYEYAVQWNRITQVGEGRTWKDSALEYLQQRRRIERTLVGDVSMNSDQTPLQAYE